ncbi:Calx-beta domain-containing protein, partial [Moorena producens]|uniref:Calx-beta domain-containing protein n=1 Tax=Moorena producens TaxID=1155739 RepID=UPI001E412931
MTRFRFAVQRVGTDLGAATVDYRLEEASPLSVDDFSELVVPAGVVNFDDGQSVAYFSVDIAADTVVEPNELLTLVLRNPSDNLVLGVDRAESTVVNDDENTLRFGVEEFALVEGETIEVPIHLTAIEQHEVFGEFVVRPAESESVDPSDFPGGKYPSGSFVLEPGKTEVSVTLATSDDLAIEPTEQFLVDLVALRGGEELSGGTVIGALFDNDSSVGIRAVDGERHEGGNGESVSIEFEVFRQGNVSQDASVAFAAFPVGDAPVSRNDFVGGEFPSGNFEFAAGQDSGFIAIEIRGDDIVESDERFGVRLGELQGASFISDSEALGTIRNDDTRVNVLVRETKL